MTLLDLKQRYGISPSKSAREALNEILRRTRWGAELLDLATLTNQMMHRYPPGSDERETYRMLHERLALVCDDLREAILTKHNVGQRGRSNQQG